MDTEQSSSALLLSLDMFMEAYHAKMALGNDIIQLVALSKANQWMHNWDLKTLLLKQEKVIVVTNPSLSIVFASSNLFNMNGYTPEEVSGKTPGLFQGPGTDANKKAIIKQAVKDMKPFHVLVVNYKKNGKPYDCEIEGFPVFNAANKLVNFVAFEKG